MLGTADSATDRIVALEVGATQFLTKPCNPRELIAHVRALVRRAAAPTPLAEIATDCSYGFLGWCFDVGTQELTDPGGTLIELSRGEVALLRAFVEQPRRVWSRKELLEVMPARAKDSSERGIDVRISRLRRKMKSDGVIRTVSGSGYIFVPRVERH
jgi:two-component system OmpR family response regulator